MPLVYIGLGTNLGDRNRNIEDARAAVSHRKGITVIRESVIRETDPVDFLEQPHFLNQVILVRTVHEPLLLLEILQEIENIMGRVRTVLKGPRVIDLDILLYDTLIMTDPELIIPHPAIKNRAFVMEQLIELDPDLADPESGVKYRLILAKLTGSMP